MWLVVGLGNPGPEYTSNRHNVGFRVVDEVARRAGVSGGWRSKFGGEVAQGEVGGQKVVLLKPMKYMNLSGESVQPLVAFHKIDLGNIVVIHDELDLDPGRLQVKVGGGVAGHNGLKSIRDRLASAEFVRVRVGIGRGRGNAADYVLSNFSKGEQADLPNWIAEAADAVELVLKEGTTAAMNRHNRKKDSLLPGSPRGT